RPGYLAKIFTKGFKVHVPASQADVKETGWKAVPSNVRVGEIILDKSNVEIARNEDHDALEFAIHKLRLKSVSQDQPFYYDLWMRNAVPPGEVRAQGKFGPWKSGSAGETPVQGDYEFQGADLSVFSGISGTLSSTDKFAGQLGHIEANGSIDIPDFALTRAHHPVHLSAK